MGSLRSATDEMAAGGGRLPRLKTTGARDISSQSQRVGLVAEREEVLENTKGKREKYMRVDGLYTTRL